MHPPTMQHAGCGFGGSSAVIAGDSTVAQLWALWVAPIVGDVLGAFVCRVRRVGALGRRQACRKEFAPAWVGVFHPARTGVEPPSG